MLISLDNAGIYRSKKWLVRGVSMRVEPGEIVTLIGPNGSGKSTTAKLALGVLATDEGTAYRKPKLRVSYVPQKLELSWTLPLTVSRFLRLTHKANKTQIHNALAATEMTHLANMQMSNLSGGEFQRVLLARAIMSSPELLVLDEPVQGVDFNGEMALYKLIEKIRNELNCGILLISHDLHVVMSTTDRVICLNGHVCCSGTPASVTSSHEFKTLFGEHTASGLALYQHQHDHEHLPDGSIEPDGHIEGKEAALAHNHLTDNGLLPTASNTTVSAKRSNADV
ncbi:ATP-binding cassette domain-containing protein [Candidatus Puniceispirillum sp.]|uniref:ATP-binding cassette domain-containing protein n=1 Tax=Candidatus Puniceispirillum sp. TaxID=2026719 RepID=UPI003F69AFFA